MVEVLDMEKVAGWENDETPLKALLKKRKRTHLSRQEKKFQSLYSHAYKPRYSYKDIETSLSHITAIRYGEVVAGYRNVTITAHPSGYSIGACNYLLCCSGKKIGIIGSTCTFSDRFAEQFDFEPFQCMLSGQRDQLDCLLLYDVAKVFDVQKEVPWKDLQSGFVSRIISALQKHETPIIIPCSQASGLFYDVLQILIEKILRHNNLPMARVAVLSSVAAAACALSEVHSEWMSSSAQQAALRGESPLLDFSPHKDRIKFFESFHTIPGTSEGVHDFTEMWEADVTGSLSRPLIVLCGHESLLFGDMPWLLRNLRQQKKPRATILPVDPRHMPVAMSLIPSGVTIHECPLDLRFSANDLLFVISRVLPRTLFAAVSEPDFRIIEQKRPPAVKCRLVKESEPIDLDIPTDFVHGRIAKQNLQWLGDVAAMDDGMAYARVSSTVIYDDEGCFAEVRPSTACTNPLPSSVAPKSRFVSGTIKVETLKATLKEKNIQFDVVKEDYSKPDDPWILMSFPSLNLTLQLWPESMITKFEARGPVKGLFEFDPVRSIILEQLTIV